MRTLLLSILLTLLASTGWSQGIPFIRNYTATEYGGHNQNFDIMTGDDGTVYVANFEGLLYYDHAEWHMLHTPGVTRITALFRDSKGTIWTGGYNYIGYVEIAANGCPTLHSIVNNKTFHGEVQWIWERDGNLFFLVSDKEIYTIINGNVAWAQGASLPKTGPSTFIGEAHVNQVQQLGDYHLKVLATDGEGLVFQYKDGKEIFRITENNGLCSNNVKFVTYDGHGLIWGATDNGIFSIGFPSVYTHLTANEGLRGEVLALTKYQGEMYAGTQYGLFHMKGKSFVQIPEISYACWQLGKQGDNLLAATADGIYLINSSNKVSQLTTANTLSLMVEEDGFYSGEVDGIYHYDSHTRQHKKISDIEKVVKIVRDKNQIIWIQNLYGHIWKSNNGHHFEQVKNSEDEIATLVSYNNEVTVVKSTATEPFPYPAFSYADDSKNLWLTDTKGKNLYAMKDGDKQKLLSDAAHPLMDFSVRAMVHDNDLLWMGGDKGVNVVSLVHKDPVKEAKATLRIRSIYLHGGDSILWGGYGNMPTELPTLSSEDRHITFTFSTNIQSLLLKTQYRTRMDDGNWSAWDYDTREEYPNLSPGKHVFEVQARDSYGRITEPVSISFTIMHPFYMRWYMNLLYLILLGIIIYAVMRWRLYRLERDKQQLETLVQERTQQVVRLEKMATVGKLTQGLIDRILNPLNYINNFAKLSQGLIKDATANIEDEKERMDQDNYEDTMDVLDMLKGNLEKVGEHGANTTRTLKAMEEMLKDRSGGRVSMNLTSLLQQDKEMLEKYYAQEIAAHHIKIAFDIPNQELTINANPEMLSKTFMSMLGNAVYAISKKASRTAFEPVISLKVEQQSNAITIAIRDNGIGIESTIIDKVFDPFFTTKPTGEASGVGLYLSREIIQNHDGDITVESVKDEYTEFIITLPIA
jgi:signal transduction histidine kinase/ligand-binding sensor domain-containing protein